MSLLTWRILTRRSEKRSWKFRWRKSSKSDFAFVHLCFPCLPDFYYYYIYKIYKTRQWNSLVNQHETIKQNKKPQLPFIEHFTFPLSLAWTDRKLCISGCGSFTRNGEQDQLMESRTEMALESLMRYERRVYTICFRKQMSGKCLTERQTKKCLRVNKVQEKWSEIQQPDGYTGILFFFWSSILVPQPRTEPVTPAMEVRRLNPWITRQVSTRVLHVSHCTCLLLFTHFKIKIMTN